MMGLLITLWPGRPVMILAMSYEPPMRAARVGSSNLRTPTIDAAALTQLASLIDRESH